MSAPSDLDPRSSELSEVWDIQKSVPPELTVPTFHHHNAVLLQTWQATSRSLLDKESKFSFTDTNYQVLVWKYTPSPVGRQRFFPFA